MFNFSSSASLFKKELDHKLFGKKFDQKQRFRSSLFLKSLQLNDFGQATPCLCLNQKLG